MQTYLSVERAAAVPVPGVVAAPVHHQNKRVRLGVKDVPVVCMPDAQKGYSGTQGVDEMRS